MKKLTKIIVFLFFVNLSFAQNITNAKLKPVSQNGLHKLILPVEIRSFSEKDLSDFRILDSKGNEVPYFADKNAEAVSNSSYKEYKIVSKSEIPKKHSLFIFENPEKTINQVALTIANYDGEKTYSLSGSNDQKQWFGISNNNYLSDLNVSDATFVSKTIEFPLTNYKYIKIDLDDKKSLPIRIIGVGNFNSKTKLTSLLNIDFKQKTIIEEKAEKKTQIHVVFENVNFLDQINFDITNPKMYKRYATIYKIVSVKIKHKFVDQKIELISFELNSDSQNTFNLASLHEKDFYIEIENDDNQPLEIKDIQFSQVPVYVIADLKTNENYTIKTGNPNLIAPVYDIPSFKNSISSNLPIAEILNIQTVKTTIEVSTKKEFWQESWFMWVCICVAAIAILYFTSSLIKDMKKSEE
jgi:hypothetical protein